MTFKKTPPIVGSMDRINSGESKAFAASLAKCARQPERKRVAHGSGNDAALSGCVKTRPSGEDGGAKPNHVKQIGSQPPRRPQLGCPSVMPTLHLHTMLARLSKLRQVLTLAESTSNEHRTGKLGLLGLFECRTSFGFAFIGLSCGRTNLCHTCCSANAVRLRCVLNCPCHVWEG